MNVCPAEVYQNGKTKSFRVQGDKHKGVRNIYSVILFPKGWSCDCIFWSLYGKDCKHIKFIKKIMVNKDGKK